MIPATLYGPGDNFDGRTSHALSALLTRFHQAQQSGLKEVIVWGSGTPRREFLYVDDLADACILLMNLEDGALSGVAEETGWVLNAGFGEDLTIMGLASTIKKAVGFGGQIRTDPSRPDGAGQKLLDSGRMRKLGWRPQVTLADGIQKTYSWYKDTEANVPEGLGKSM